MILSWNINRYARCYSDSSQQCLDFDKRNSIFQYFAHLETQKSQYFGHFWSIINTCANWNMILNLNLDENKKIILTVCVIDIKSNLSIILVKQVWNWLLFMLLFRKN